jgi:hypothetical protein
MQFSLKSLFRRVPAGPTGSQQGPKRRRRRMLLIVALIFGATAVGGRVGLQLILHSQVAGKTGTPEHRETLFQLLRPVALANCQLERFGEPYDGGYLLCANLLKDVQAGYSYGISGYDKWGCDVSTKRGVPVHQYDCFDTTRPSCPGGRPVFHAECVAGVRSIDDKGRLFDSLQSQFSRNGDADKHLVVKMDVEGAEWESILKTPDEVLARIDQLLFEFHGVSRGQYLEVMTKLKRTFEIVHLHFNNYSCLGAGAPFPAWAYEVTLVNKRLAQVDPAGKVTLPNPLDAPNLPVAPDCQSRAILD